MGEGWKWKQDPRGENPVLLERNGKHILSLPEGNLAFDSGESLNEWIERDRERMSVAGYTAEEWMRVAIELIEVVDHFADIPDERWVEIDKMKAAIRETQSS